MHEHSIAEARGPQRKNAEKNKDRDRVGARAVRQVAAPLSFISLVFSASPLQLLSVDFVTSGGRFFLAAAVSCVSAAQLRGRGRGAKEFPSLASLILITMRLATCDERGPAAGRAFPRALRRLAPASARAPAAPYSNSSADGIAVAHSRFTVSAP